MRKLRHGEVTHLSKVTQLVIKKNPKQHENSSPSSLAPNLGLGIQVGRVRGHSQLHCPCLCSDHSDGDPPQPARWSTRELGRWAASQADSGTGGSSQPEMVFYTWGWVLGGRDEGIQKRVLFSVRQVILPEGKAAAPKQ